MSVQVFCLTPERYLRSCSLPDRLAAGSEGPPCWIDIDDREPVALEKLLRSLGLHPLAIEACLDSVPTSRLVAYGKSLFIALPMHAAWGADDHSFLWLVCLPGILVTIHDSEITALKSIIQQYDDAMRFHGNSTSAILYQILDHIIDDDMAFTLRTRDAISRLDELLEEGNSAELTKETQPLKRQLTRLVAAFEDQLYCVGALQTIESESFSIEGLQDYFRDAVSHLEHATRAVGRQAAHINVIHQDYQLRLQDKTNKRLRLLTIISTIFMPLSLIAGIYGMNFRDMPELGWPFAYYGVLFLMIAMAAAMLWGFSRAGWFR